MQAIYWNLIIFLLSIPFLFITVTLFTYLYKKIGLYILMSITFIIANIQFLKEISLPFIESIPLGSVIIAANCLASDILNQFYSKKDAQKAVSISLMVGIVWNIVFLYTLWYVPSSRSIEIHHAFYSLFGLSLQAFVASYIAYFLSQSLNIFLFHTMKDKISLYSCSIISTTISGIIDYFVFIFLFYIVFKQDSMPLLDILFYFGIISYTVRFLISFLSLPFLYFLKKTEKKWKNPDSIVY